MNVNHELNELPISCRSWSDLYRDILRFVKPESRMVDFHMQQLPKIAGGEMELHHYKFELDYLKARIFDELGLFTGTMTREEVVAYDNVINHCVHKAIGGVAAADVISKHTGVVRLLNSISVWPSN